MSDAQGSIDAQIAACPTPVYHETHRYCPSCPWTENYGKPVLELFKQCVNDELEQLGGHMDKLTAFLDTEPGVSAPAEPTEVRRRLGFWLDRLERETSLEHRDNDEQVKVEGRLLHNLQQAGRAALAESPVAAEPPFDVLYSREEATSWGDQDA